LRYDVAFKLEHNYVLSLSVQLPHSKLAAGEAQAFLCVTAETQHWCQNSSCVGP
jgi:hypothetical protein